MGATSSSSCKPGCDRCVTGAKEIDIVRDPHAADREQCYTNSDVSTAEAPDCARQNMGDALSSGNFAPATSSKAWPVSSLRPLESMTDEERLRGIWSYNGGKNTYCITRNEDNLEFREDDQVATLHPKPGGWLEAELKTGIVRIRCGGRPDALESQMKDPDRSDWQRVITSVKERRLCDEGHELLAYVAPGGIHFCDQCLRADITAPEQIYRCEACDFDLCERCFALEEPSGQVDVPEEFVAIVEKVAVQRPNIEEWPLIFSVAQLLEFYFTYALCSSLGGIEAHTQFVNCLLDLTTGCSTRLEKLSQSGTVAMGKLTNLDMNFTWNKESTCLSEYLGDGKSFAVFTNLQYLLLDLHGTRITDLQAIGNGISQLSTLNHLVLDLSYTPISETVALTDALGQIKTINHLVLELGGTRVSDVNALGSCLRYLKSLKYFSLHLYKTLVSDVRLLGLGIAHLTMLEHFALDLHQTQVLDVRTVGDNLGRLIALNHLVLDLRSTLVVDVRPVGEGIGRLTKLQNLALDLRNTQVSDVKALAHGLRQVSTLDHLRLELGDSHVAHHLRRRFERPGDLLAQVMKGGKQCATM